jgi:hypothetical protein
MGPVASSGRHLRTRGRMERDSSYTLSRMARGSRCVRKRCAARRRSSLRTFSIEPIFEPDFDEAALGYRPTGSALDAVRHVSRAINEGHSEIVDADLSRYFDSKPHSTVLRCLARRIRDRKRTRLRKDVACFRRRRPCAPLRPFSTLRGRAKSRTSVQSTVNGGEGRESNPPRNRFDPQTGFEDQRRHRASSFSERHSLSGHSCACRRRATS